MAKELHLFPVGSRPLAVSNPPGRTTMLPPLPTPSVERSDLIGRILATAGIHLAIAPLGYGKTTLLLQLAGRARADGQSVAWLGLSNLEQKSARLFRMLERAFGFEPDSCGECTATLMARIDAIPGAALYIDNLEALSGAESLAIITQLIEGLRNCRLFVAGRSSADLKLSRLTLAGRVHIVDATQLAFTVGEVQTMFAGLPIEDAESMIALTEGWPVAAGAMLLAERGQKQSPDLDDPSVPLILARYFEENVLEACSETDARMLMETAVFERFSQTLLAEVPGRTCDESDIASLMRRHLPIKPVDERLEWYCFHRPFQAFLRQRLRRLDADRCSELHRFAAGWFERHGFTTESIRHAVLCADPQVMAGVMERANVFRLSLHQGLSLLRIEQLPSLRAIVQYPLLTLGQIYLKAQEGRIEEARAHFEQMRCATHSLESLLSEERAEEVRHFTDTVDIVLGFYEDRPVEIDQIERLERLVVEVSDHDPVMVATAASLLAPAYLSIGRVEAAANMADLGLASLRGIHADPLAFYLEVQQIHSALALGRIREASLHTDRAQGLASRAFGAHHLGDAIVNILKGVVHYESNELDAAETLLSRSLHRDSLSTGWFELYAEALSAAADTAAVLHGADAVDAVLADAEIIAAQRRLPRLVSLVAILRMRSASDAGNLPYAMNLLHGSAIAQLLISADTPASLWSLKLRTLALLETARLYNRLGRARDSVAQLAAIDRRYIETGDARVRFTYQMLAMETTFQLHRNDEATSYFCDGLNLALESGFARRLLGYRRQILEVFDWMMSSGRPISLRVVEFCGSALRPAGDSDSRLQLHRRLLPGRRSAPAAGANLTEREAEILGMIAEGLSTKEIAYRISVTVSTVKTHRKNLFGKLGVTRRSQAVAYAREKMII
jgi:LuxR family transcriptional regulator, maltose regulon positive regulatory protein